MLYLICLCLSHRESLWSHLSMYIPKGIPLVSPVCKYFKGNPLGIICLCISHRESLWSHLSVYIPKGILQVSPICVYTQVIQSDLTCLCVFLTESLWSLQSVYIPKGIPLVSLVCTYSKGIFLVSPHRVYYARNPSVLFYLYLCIPKRIPLVSPILPKESLSYHMSVHIPKGIPLVSPVCTYSQENPAGAPIWIFVQFVYTLLQSSGLIWDTLVAVNI